MSLIRSLDSMAREHTESAVQTIVAIMNDPDLPPKDRLKAAQEILDRGHGKPINATISIPASRLMQQKIEAMTDAELMAVVQSHELPRISPTTFVPAGTPADDTEIDYSDDPLLK